MCLFNSCQQLITQKVIATVIFYGRVCMLYSDMVDVLRKYCPILNESVMLGGIGKTKIVLLESHVTSNMVARQVGKAE